MGLSLSVHLGVILASLKRCILHAFTFVKVSMFANQFFPGKQKLMPERESLSDQSLDVNEVVYRHDLNAGAAIRRLMLVTDAWQPQTNGVVTTLNHWVAELRAAGVEVEVVCPQGYKSFPLPSYPEIKMVWRAPDLWQRIQTFQPHALHIATEGTLGWQARRLALRRGIPFTTGYHTKYPEYVQQRWPWISSRWVYRILRRFHKASKNVLVPAPSIQAELQAKGFHKVGVVSRGVNTELFSPSRAKDLDYPKPIMLYVGRVAPEKNIASFLRLDLPGTKLIVGKGPQLEELQQQYPDTVFLGAKYGEELAELYASADVFVFPSLTDTFGVVNIEALASGTPVAAFQVTGPKDIVVEGVNGFLQEETDQSLALQIQKAIKLKQTVPAEQIVRSVEHFKWPEAARQFYSQLYPIERYITESE